MITLVVIKRSHRVDSLIINVIFAQLFLGLINFLLLNLNEITVLVVLHLDTIIVIAILNDLRISHFLQGYATLGLSESEVLGRL